MPEINLKLKSYDELTMEISKLNGDKYLLQQENQQLKRQIEIKDKWCQLIIDLGIDYDGYTQSDSLKLLIDDLVKYASNSIKADDKTIAYTNGLSNFNILEEEIGDNNE